MTQNRTDRQKDNKPTVEETKENNDVLGAILKSADQESQAMLQSMGTREVREVTYNFDNPLEIPVALEDRMEAEGMSLRWLRFKVDGGHDTKNITKRVRQGYTLVTHGEAPELSIGLTSSSDGEFVVLDDVVLAKIPTEQLEKLRGQLDAKANHQEDGITANFREGAAKSGIDYGNLRDNSKYSASGGPKRRNFAAG